MAIALVASVSAKSTDTNGFTTGTITTTGANLLVAVLSGYNSFNTPTVTDSKSNTWTPLTLQNSVGNHSLVIAYSVPTSVGTTHSFNLVGATTYGSLCVISVSGSHTTPFDQENGHIATISSTVQAGSVTPTQDNELIIAGVSGDGDSNASSIDGSYNLVENQTTTANCQSGALAYLIQTSAAATNPTWTLTGSANIPIAVIATFKAAAVAASGTAKHLMLLGSG